MVTAGIDRCITTTFEVSLPLSVTRVTMLSQIEAEMGIRACKLHKLQNQDDWRHE